MNVNSDIRSHIHPAIRKAFDAVLGKRADTEWQAGDDLAAATARKLGIPLAKRRRTHPDLVPHPVNRAARRQRGEYGPLTTAQRAAHPHLPRRKATVK